MKRRMFLSGIVALTTVSVVAPTLPAKATPIFPVYEIIKGTVNHSLPNPNPNHIVLGNYPGWPVGTRFYRTGEFREYVGAVTGTNRLEKQIRVDNGEIRYQISIEDQDILIAKLSFYSDDPYSENWWRRVT